MCAMAALSNPQTFRLDMKVEEARATGLERAGNYGPSLRRSVAKQAAAAAGAADLGGGGACCRGTLHQIIDLRRRYPRRQLLPVLPLNCDLTADFIPVAPFERAAHRHCCVANALEAVEDRAVAIDMTFDDFPVIRP